MTMTTTPAPAGPSLDTVGAVTDAAPAPGAPPFRNPGLGFLVGLGAAAIALMASLLSVGILTMPLKANLIDAAHATTIISIASTFAGISALVVSPIVGRMSDRTLGRFGRRRPYLVLGAALILLGAYLVLLAASTAVLTIGWVVMGVGQVSAFAALGSVIPDQLAPDRRGPASALFGVAGTAGAVLGLFIASRFTSLAPMIMLPAALAVILLLGFAVTVHDAPLARSERPALVWSDVFGTFWVNPVKFPGYALAFASRFAIFCAIAAVNAYQAVFLIMGLHISPSDVAGKLFLGNLLMGVTALVFATGLGKLSDKVGRRKPFVVAAAVIFAVGLALVAGAHGFGGFLVAVTVMGLGQGVYLAVDFALITQVLPDPRNPAKDLGIMNLASSLPNIVVPAIAPVLLAVGASAAVPQNFVSFFGAAAIAGAIGAVLIVPIRGVR